MANVTGPCSTLPGSSHHFPEGTMCDYHPDRPAVIRIQGETDSMGAEYEDLCEECLKADRERVKNEDTSGNCDWCKRHADKLFHRRSTDEGSHGPVYLVCKPCIDRSNARLQAELDEWDRCNPPYEEDDFDDEPSPRNQDRMDEMDRDYEQDTMHKD